MAVRARGVAVVDAGELLVVRRYEQGRRYAVLPGGGVEPGESPDWTALRELTEETGLVGSVVGHLWTLVHEDRTAHYYRVSAAREPLALGGPEARAETAARRYRPEWVALAAVQDVDLQPPEVRDRVRGINPA